MNQITRRSTQGLSVFVGILLTTAALAAPIGGTSPSQDCYSRAEVQRTLDYAQCAALPVQIRTACVSQAEQNYARAVAACGGTSQKTSVMKQNIDASFLRRLRN